MALSYPPGATRSVTVKATPGQRATWEATARQRGMASAGAFLAWAGDLYLALEHAYFDAARRHDESLSPVGYAEEEKRRQEWEGEP